MRVQAKIHLDAGTTRSIAFGGGRVWVSTESGVVALDPATNAVVQTIDLIEPKREVGPDRHRLPRWRSVGLDRMTPSRDMTSKTNGGQERAGTILVVPR
jgi:hypothetical protein